MKLSDYLEARGESERAFAARCRPPVDPKTINRTARGITRPGVGVALAIVQATVRRPTSGGGTVSFEELGDAQRRRTA